MGRKENKDVYEALSRHGCGLVMEVTNGLYCDTYQHKLEQATDGCRSIQRHGKTGAQLLSGMAFVHSDMPVDAKSNAFKHTDFVMRFDRYDSVFLQLAIKRALEFNDPGTNERALGYISRGLLKSMLAAYYNEGASLPSFFIQDVRTPAVVKKYFPKYRSVGEYWHAFRNAKGVVTEQYVAMIIELGLPHKNVFCRRTESLPHVPRSEGRPMHARERDGRKGKDRWRHVEIDIIVAAPRNHLLNCLEELVAMEFVTLLKPW